MTTWLIREPQCKRSIDMIGFLLNSGLCRGRSLESPATLAKWKAPANSLTILAFRKRLQRPQHPQIQKGKLKAATRAGLMGPRASGD
jgi:hypothetical protein